MSVAAERVTGYRPAVGYLRRSTDRQEQSIEDQRRAIERYAEEHGYIILFWYIDDAISGTSSDERKAFLKMIDDAAASDCPFRYVLTYSISRFSRGDNDEVGFFRYQLRRNGVEVVYIAEGFNGDDTDDLLRPVKQWQARNESRELSKVTIRGLLTRSSEGWWSGGQPPYGYDLRYCSGDGRFLMVVRYDHDLSKQILDEDGNVTRVVPRGESLALSKRDHCTLVPSAPERVRVVRDMFSWYTHHGLGFKGIADRLNQQDIPSPRGGAWSGTHRDKWAMTTVRDILLNPVYTGDFVWNRHSFAKFHRIEKGRAVPRRAAAGAGPDENSPSDWIVVKDAHPALISRTLFADAQQRRQERRRGPEGVSYRSGRGAKSPYLLGGLIQCQRCGQNWQGYSTQKGRKRKDGTATKTYYYACGGYVAKGNAVCERSVLPKEPIEEWVFAEIGLLLQEYLSGEEGEATLRTMIEQEVAGEGRFDGSELATLRQQRRDVEAQIENLLDNLTPTNREFVDRRIEKLRDQLVSLDQQEGVLLEQQDRERQAAALTEEAMRLARRFTELPQVGTVDEKRMMVRAFLRNIDYDPSTRTGVAYFWEVPSVGQDGGGGNGRGTRSEPATTESAPEGPGRAVEGMSSLPLRNVGARSEEKRRAAGGSASSFHMVAGAGFEPATSGL
jgi:DNA invertase Pin-like site-specific DNA recombinase